MEKQVNIPKLRFPEFEGKWEKNKFSEHIKLYRGSSPRPINLFITKESNGVNWIKIGDTKNCKNFLIDNVEEKITFEGAKKSRKVFKGELILANSMSFGKTYLLDLEGCIYDGWFVLREFEQHFNKEYLHQLLNSNYLQKQYKTLSTGGVVQNISSEIVYDTFLLKPCIKEQTKIASFLTTVDDKLQALKKKKQLLAQYKKGVMQKIFSQELRFKDENGNDYPDWEEKKLGDCLDYIQPTKYLVSSTVYDNSYSTPVLTAGKTFILGYTNETEGIYNENLPVIIFDDFTTSSQFVDFPFKAKSSAMKILIANEEINIKFIFEAMQVLKYEVGGHERHWISKFAYLEVELPCFEEQTKIANFLSAIDEKIQAVEVQIEKMEVWKKGLLQQMFC